MAKLDVIDKMILATVQKSGRMTNVELSATVGISAPPCLRRLKLLETAGIITGYHAEINRDVLGYTIFAICIVSISQQSYKNVKHFIKIISGMQNVRSCLSTVGGEFFALTIVAKDLNEYNKVLTTDLQGSNIVASIKSFILVNEHKKEVGIPIDCTSENDG
ncbi:MAG: Lrp/AsnC family transcriptional regulator [Holosporales bacterium]|jgi:DNA-binding Lrp family transcriptional regulator|nr:Lrp/AsnC family transcriptional regulator [Holosporales bacterium]